MNHQKIREELSKAEQAVEQLKKLLNEPEGCWKPKEGFSCYIVYGDGSIGCETYNIERYGVIGHAFPTRAAAELHVKKLKVIQKLKEMAGGHKPVWADNKYENWFIAYNHTEKKWDGTWCSYEQYHFTGVYFPSKDAVEAAITTLGDELNVLLEQ